MQCGILKGIDDMSCLCNSTIFEFNGEASRLNGRKHVVLEGGGEGGHSWVRSPPCGMHDQYCTVGISNSKSYFAGIFATLRRCKNTAFLCKNVEPRSDKSKLGY
jgi:hypothetical protein